MTYPVETPPIDARAIEFQQHDRQGVLLVRRENMAKRNLEWNPAAQQDGGLAEGGVPP